MGGGDQDPVMANFVLERKILRAERGWVMAVQGLL
jgi:hypothetical protein